MEHRLAQNQKILQKMVLTPKMKHSIQMLSMSVKDLNDYIDSILASNPFLQKQSGDFMKKYGKERSFLSGKSFSSEYDADVINKKDINPREFLLSHIRTFDLDEKNLEIAEYLIYEMDENGYIKSNPEDAAKDLFTTVEKVEEVIDIIQSLEPPGIGARDIRECLQLQLKRMQKEDSLEYAIVTDFISDLAINDIPKIAKSLGVDKEEVRHAVKNIKVLNPRPASTVLSEKAESVIPDLTATVKNNKIRLEVNRESIPHLRLYNPYLNKVDIIKDPEAREFLKENMEVAKDLLDNLKRREETMCQVADYILKTQKESVAEDNYELKTLTIKDVAEALKLHPSTVSRTLSNKYIQINDKVFSLKSFLSQGMKKENGELASKITIKNRIRELVNNEDKAKPLSDNAIKEKLTDEGIVIKRRTVAKYRESLKILPTHLRRKKSK